MEINVKETTLRIRSIFNSVVGDTKSRCPWLLVITFTSNLALTPIKVGAYGSTSLSFSSVMLSGELGEPVLQPAQDASTIHHLQQAHPSFPPLCSMCCLPSCRMWVQNNSGLVTGAAGRLSKGNLSCFNSFWAICSASERRATCSGKSNCEWF